MALLLHGTWYKLLIVTLKRILPSGTHWEGWIDILTICLSSTHQVSRP